MLTLAKIILKNGTSYITPIENLDNVKRMLAGQYNDIEFPEYQEDEEEDLVLESEGKTERKKPGRKPRNQ